MQIYTSLLNPIESIGYLQIYWVLTLQGSVAPADQVALWEL